MGVWERKEEVSSIDFNIGRKYLSTHFFYSFEGENEISRTCCVGIFLYENICEGPFMRLLKSIWKLAEFPLHSTATYTSVNVDKLNRTFCFTFDRVTNYILHRIEKGLIKSCDWLSRTPESKSMAQFILEIEFGNRLPNLLTHKIFGFKIRFC